MSANRALPLSPLSLSDGFSPEPAWERDEWPAPPEILRGLRDTITPTDAEKEWVQWLATQPEYTCDYQRYAAELSFVSGRWPSLEMKLMQWHKAHGPLVGFVLKEVLASKAKEIFRSLPEYQGKATPKFCGSWLQGFKLRYIHCLVWRRRRWSSSAHHSSDRPLARTIEHESALPRDDRPNWNGCTPQAANRFRSEPTVNNLLISGPSAWLWDENLQTHGDASRTDDSTASLVARTSPHGRSPTGDFLREQSSLSSTERDHGADNWRVLRPTDLVTAATWSLINTSSSTISDFVESTNGSTERSVLKAATSTPRNSTTNQLDSYPSPSSETVLASDMQRSSTSHLRSSPANGSTYNAHGPDRPYTENTVHSARVLSQAVASDPLDESSDNTFHRTHTTNGSVFGPADDSTSGRSVEISRQVANLCQVRETSDCGAQVTSLLAENLETCMDLGNIDPTRFYGRAPAMRMSNNLIIHSRRNAEFDFGADVADKAGSRVSKTSNGEPRESPDVPSCSDEGPHFRESEESSSEDGREAFHDSNVDFPVDSQCFREVNPGSSLEDHSQSLQRLHDREQSHKRRRIYFHDEAVRVSHTASSTEQGSAYASHHSSESNDSLAPRVTTKRRKRTAIRVVKAERDLIEVLSCSDGGAQDFSIRDGSTGVIEIYSCSENEHEEPSHSKIPGTVMVTKIESIADAKASMSTNFPTQARSQFMGIIPPTRPSVPLNHAFVSTPITPLDGSISVDASVLTSVEGAENSGKLVGGTATDNEVTTIVSVEEIDDSRAYSPCQNNDSQVYGEDDCDEEKAHDETIASSTPQSYDFTPDEYPLFVLDGDDDTADSSSGSEACPVHYSPASEENLTECSSTDRNEHMPETTSQGAIKKMSRAEYNTIVQHIADMISEAADNELARNERRSVRDLQRAQNLADRARIDNREIALGSRNLPM